MIEKETSERLISKKLNELKYTWITHSTTLISLKNFTIMTDPFLSGLVGPLYVRFLAKFENCKSHGILPIKV